MRNEYIPKALKEYRKKNHYSVNDVAILLNDHSVDVSPKTIYGWESGQSQPSADILLTLCEIYNIPNILAAFGYESQDCPSINLTSHECNLIRSYREHPHLQEAVNILLDCYPTEKKKRS